MPAVHREGLEPFANELGVELADLLAGELRPEHQEGPARDIDGDAAQRLVHGQMHTRVAGYALLVAEGLQEGLAQRDADILDGVMLVDMQVTLASHCDVEQSVAREKLQHMVEEADAGLDLGRTCAIEGEADRDVGLGRLARNARGAHGIVSVPQQPPSGCAGLLATPVPGRHLLAQTLGRRPS